MPKRHPRCLLGDFNIRHSIEETCGGNTSCTAGIRDFQESICSLGVTDLRSVGAEFTWWDSNIHNPIYRKLDRCWLMITGWINSLKFLQIFFLVGSLIIALLLFC